VIECVIVINQFLFSDMVLIMIILVLLPKLHFEETPEMFLRAARHAELDPMRGVSANVMCGQQGYFGTAAFQVMLDY